MPEINFKSTGDKGSKVILLHGFCESLEIWKDILDPLAEYHQVILIDLPGFGHSELPGGQITIDKVADIIHHWLCEFTGEKVALLGHSLGGYITLSLAERYPEKLYAFGLINSTAYADDDDKRIKRIKTVEFLEKNGKDKFLDSFIPGLFIPTDDKTIANKIAWMRDLSGKTPLETMIGYTLAMKGRPSRDYLLLKENLPVLFLAGEKDSIVPKEHSRAQMEMINKGQSAFVDRCGHMAMLENPTDTAKSIIKFLQNFS